MKCPPVPRQHVYDLYWYFASERQRSYEARLAGQPGPWTVDPIIQQYKFCNVYRAADRVSQYLIGEVCYHLEECSAVDRLFQILAFRIFSKIETWRDVHSLLGNVPTLQDLRSGGLTRALEETKQRIGGLYTGAFILCASDAYSCSLKHLNHIE